jgi:hypothetical protein
MIGPLVANSPDSVAYVIRIVARHRPISGLLEICLLLSHKPYPSLPFPSKTAIQQHPVPVSSDASLPDYWTHLRRTTAHGTQTVLQLWRRRKAARVLCRKTQRSIARYNNLLYTSLRRGELTRCVRNRSEIQSTTGKWTAGFDRSVPGYRLPAIPQ